MGDRDFALIDLELGMLTVHCQILKLSSRESMDREPVTITIPEYAVYLEAGFTITRDGIGEQKSPQKIARAAFLALKSSRTLSSASILS
jgi:hypothetical protein